MRLTSVAVIFSILATTFFIVQDVRVRQLENTAYNTMYVKTILENSAEDAALAMKKSSSYYKGSIGTMVDIKENMVFEAYLDSVSEAFGVTAKEEKHRFNKYLPVLILLTDKGYYLSVLDEVSTKDGTFIKRITSPMKRYSVEKDGVYYFFSLSDAITVLYRDKTGELAEVTGTKEELLSDKTITADISYLENLDVKKVIAERLNQDVNVSINIYNHKMKEYGNKINYYFSDITYKLDRAVESPSLISIFAGYDGFAGGEINMVSVSRLQIKQRNFYTGFVQDGVKYYADRVTAEKLDVKPLDVFVSEIDAAKKGYFKYH